MRLAGVHAGPRLLSDPLAIDGRAPGSHAGRLVHPDHAAPGRLFHASRCDRLHDPSKLDGVVVATVARLAALDGHGPVRLRRCPAYLDADEPWEKLDRYGGHAARAHAGGEWSVSMGTAPVLRLCRADHRRKRAAGGELVRRRGGHGTVCDVGNALPDRGGETDRALRGRVPAVHGTDQPVCTEGLTWMNRI